MLQMKNRTISLINSLKVVKEKLSEEEAAETAINNIRELINRMINKIKGTALGALTEEEEEILGTRNLNRAKCLEVNQGAEQSEVKEEIFNINMDRHKVNINPIV